MRETFCFLCGAEREGVWWCIIFDDSSYPPFFCTRKSRWCAFCVCVWSTPLLHSNTPNSPQTHKKTVKTSQAKISIASLNVCVQHVQNLYIVGTCKNCVIKNFVSYYCCFVVVVVCVWPFPRFPSSSLFFAPSLSHKTRKLDKKHSINPCKINSSI